MSGTRREDRIYYGCHGPRNTRGQPTTPDHPGAIYLREDLLLPAIHRAIAANLFAPADATLAGGPGRAPAKS
ncbi:hypothetical protein GCM10022251_77690 [Phytohabitans flavus]|uniref:Uncharacterized protein n=1 Tax=Phytohabitans flavus TaxID=1076124 RepID=A0A6F8XIL6_9ACTN|nr:hypothetical protein [Phytohabitans flavus]BCB73638.1 hypothetical protein Pflav_000480 [Phytohabitans flavus]